ncbi:MAG: ATP-binding protein [Promethearchaeota archaeon]
MSSENLHREDMREEAHWEIHPRLWRGIELTWILGTVCCALYLLLVYVLPLAGLVNSVSIPFRSIVEIFVCGVPLSTGCFVLTQRLLSEQTLMEIVNDLLVLRLHQHVVAVCCLDITSVPGSVRIGESERPEYDAGFLLALRAGMDGRVNMTYEVGVLNGEPYLRIFITASGRALDEIAELLKREATRTEAILLASLNNIELHQLKGEDLREASLRLIDAEFDGDSGLSFETDRNGLMVLTGEPRVLPLAESSQVGTFISTALKQGCDVVFSCVFSKAKPGREQRRMERQWSTIREKEKRKEDSLADQSRKRRLVRHYEEIQSSAGWFDTTVHILMKSDASVRMQEIQERVTGLVHSIWGDGDNIRLKKKAIRKKTALRMLLRRHMTRQRIHVSRLVAFVNTPVQQLPVIAASQIPDFPVPAKELVDNELKIGQAVFGGRRLNIVGLRTEWLREHVAVLGATGTGKTTLVKHLMAELSRKSKTPWWVFDIKGSDYVDLLDACDGEILVLRPGIDSSFVMDFMDSEVDSLKRHAHTTFAILREVLTERGTTSELSPAMEKLLRNAVLRVAEKQEKGNSVQSLLDAIYDLAGKDRIGGMTRDAVTNRLEILSREPLGSILGGGPNAVKISELMNKRVILDLQHVARTGGMEAARLLYNLIAKRIFDYALQRGIRDGLHHVVVLEEASNLVPESYARHSAADVTTGESMVMLQRATGQGVIVVSTRPNVSSNILANTATKVTFRLPYDSIVGARFMSLDNSQEKYLRTMKRGRALIVMPGIETFELATWPFAPESRKKALTRESLDLPERPHYEDTAVVVSEEADSEGDASSVFDRLGELGSHVVAFLASRDSATQIEIQGLLGSIDSRMEEEDIHEVIRDLVSLGTVDREALSLVPGGFVFTLPGRGLRAVRDAIAGYIMDKLELFGISREEDIDDGSGILIEDKAILILPEHVKASSMGLMLDKTREYMTSLGNNVAELILIVRGSVAAAKLREIMSGSEDFNPVTVISAFPSSLDTMIENLFPRVLSGTESTASSEQAKLGDDIPKAEQVGLIGAMHDIGSATNRAIQMRLWFQLIQDFVDLSDGKIQWDVLLEFIETTAMQSVKGNSTPLGVEEGKRALTELLADEVLIALRVGEKPRFVKLHEGLWIVNSAMLKEFKDSVIGALEKDLSRQGNEVERSHGYFDLCYNDVSYVIFPNQQQLNTLLHIHSEVACRTCKSTRIIGVLTAAEYLEEDMVMPENVKLYDFSEYLSVTAATG